MTDQQTKPTKSSYTLTYHDPSRTFDGTPYQASGKSILQVDQILRLLQRGLIDTNTQARNAFMQRNIDAGQEPQVENWAAAPEARILMDALNGATNLRKRLPALMRAVSYDPNAAIDDD